MVTGINLTPGELRTRIRVQRCVRTRPDGEIEETARWIDLGNAAEDDPPRYKRCQWIGAHGTEAWTDDALMGTQQATIRLRYDERISAACRVLLGGEVWEIVSLDDVRRAHEWMELKLVRKEAGG